MGLVIRWSPLFRNGLFPVAPASSGGFTSISAPRDVVQNTSARAVIEGSSGGEDGDEECSSIALLPIGSSIIPQTHSLDFHSSDLVMRTRKGPLSVGQGATEIAPS